MISIEIKYKWPNRRKEKEKEIGELILYISSSEENTNNIFNIL
jgi:hypothetical protein